MGAENETEPTSHEPVKINKGVRINTWNEQAFRADLPQSNWANWLTAKAAWLVDTPTQWVHGEDLK